MRRIHSGRGDASKENAHRPTPCGSGAPSQSPNVSVDIHPCDQPRNKAGEQSKQPRMEDDQQGVGRLDGGVPPLTISMNLQKRARKFDKDPIEVTHKPKNLAERMQPTRPSHFERRIHHSEDANRSYPPGLQTTFQQHAPAATRRRSEGDVQLRPERNGRIEYNRRGAANTNYR